MALLQLLDMLLDNKGFLTLKVEKGGSPTFKNMGIFFGGSGHGPESSCQISAYYKFFPGLNVFRRISTGLRVVLVFYCIVPDSY